MRFGVAKDFSHWYKLMTDNRQLIFTAPTFLQIIVRLFCFIGNLLIGNGANIL